MPGTNLLGFRNLLLSAVLSHGRAFTIIPSPTVSHRPMGSVSLLFFTPTGYQDNAESGLLDLKRKKEAPDENPSPDEEILRDDAFTAALDRAKQMDRHYGVWSESSRRAWEDVDRIFASMGGGSI